VGGRAGQGVLLGLMEARDMQGNCSAIDLHPSPTFLFTIVLSSFSCFGFFHLFWDTFLYISIQYPHHMIISILRRFIYDLPAMEWRIQLIYSTTTLFSFFIG
jgi:hypothetical protein